MNGTIQLFATSVVCFLVSSLTGELKTFSVEQVSSQSMFALLYLIFMGSLVAYLSYIWLLNERPAVQVSTYVYINPLIAVLLGVIFAGEQMNVAEMLSLLIILSGVLLVNVPKYYALRKIKRSAV